MSKDTLKRKVTIPLQYTITVDGGTEAEREQKFRELVRWVKQYPGYTCFGGGSLTRRKNGGSGGWSVDRRRRK